MPKDRQPPLPSVARPLIIALRIGSVVIGLGAIAIVVLAASRGVWSADLTPIVAAAAVFSALGWIHPLSRWFLPLLAIAALLVIVAAGNWGVGLVVAGTVGLVIWSQRPGRRLKTHVHPDRIIITEPNSAMRNASSFIAEFQAAGFEQVGALEIPIGPIRVISSLMLAADGYSYVSVTDAVFSVTSLFPDGRSLGTGNTDLAPEPESVLPNRISGAKPAELVQSHTEALELLAETGHFPVAISAAELPQIALANERYTVEWANLHRPKVTRAKLGPLLHRPDPHAVIAEWHAGSGA